MGKDFDDPEELKQILSVVSTEIPKLIESITKTMYNQENAQNMAKSVAEFYKSMKAAGMDDKMAFELTQDFMSSFSLGSMISKAIQGGDSDIDDLDEIIEEKIREKFKKRDKHGHDEERDDDD